MARVLWQNRDNLEYAWRVLTRGVCDGCALATSGVGASTVSYKDWIGTDLLVFFGSNFANDQPVATKYVDLAKKQGTRVLAVNTYREPGLEKYWIPSTAASALFGTKLVDRFY